MPTLSTANLVDLAAAVVVILSVAGALRHRAGLLGAVGSGVLTLLVLWLVAVGVVAWGPSELADITARSLLVDQVPHPGHAVAQVDGLLGTRGRAS